MNDKKTKFYCWLIGKLEHRKMTLPEICEEWADSASNVKGVELTNRTFPPTSVSRPTPVPRQSPATTSSPSTTRT